MTIINNLIINLKRKNENSKVVFFTIFSLNSSYCIDFLQLQELLQKNSKQLQIKKLDIDISKENLNIVESKDYPSISLNQNRYQRGRLCEKR